MPCHLLARRIDVLVRGDENARVDRSQARMSVEQVGGPAQGARAPPRIVVAEPDVRGLDRPHPHVARRSSDVAWEPDHVDPAHGLDRVGGPVRGCVVDEDDPRALGKR
jgi:hypothetical protein